MNRMLRNAVLAVLIAGCSRGDLPEREARATAEQLVAAKTVAMPDLHHMEWNGLQRVSATEAYGTATLVYRYMLPGGGSGEQRIPGRFVYQKGADGEWALTSIDFPNPGYLRHQVNSTVFAKVTDASVATGTVPVTMREPGGTRRARDRDTAGADSTAVTDEGSAEAGTLTVDAARGAVERFLDENAPESSADSDTLRRSWSARSFGELATVDAATVELPAALVVEDPEGRHTYHGAFRFTQRGDTWALSSMQFRSPGLAPISQTIAPPLAVR